MGRDTAARRNSAKAPVPDAAHLRLLVSNCPREPGVHREADGTQGLHDAGRGIRQVDG